MASVSRAIANLRRADRHALGNGIFKCEGCGGYFLRRNCEIHHVDYEVAGKKKVLCKACHAKKHKKRSIKWLGTL